MKPPPTLAAALAHQGLSLEKDRLILFGSRASGEATPDSDWDLVIVGARRPAMVTRSKVVQVVPVTLRKWRSDDFYGTELAAALAFYGVPLSYETPPRSRIRFPTIRERTADRARRLWNQASRHQANGWAQDTIFRKAATSALLADRFYRHGRPAPARPALIRLWYSLEPFEKLAILRASGIEAEPPASIALEKHPQG